MIRPLEDRELPEAAALAAAAFREDPAFAHVLPDDAQRRIRLPSMFAALLRIDRAAGGLVSGAFDDGALVGLSSVLPAGAAAPSLPDWTRQLPEVGWFLFQPAALLRGLALSRAVEEHRPNGTDYLHLLAVHPATQGRGVGAALLNAAPKPLSLETFTEANLAWYEARGFKLLLEVRSPARPTFWALRR
ncbi:MAG: GNAT family N-acetyltransferase [Elusimicrobiota bacterium]|nr:GNAT family N-acetyltransferase [Elusimicrobiota bacterium]